MVKIVPAILTYDQKSFAESIKKIKGNFNEIQIDICTSDFVGINTLSVSEIEIPKNIEVGWHLMSDSFDEFDQLKKFNTVNIIVHFESLLRKKNLEDKVAKEVKWGLAVNPETDVSQIRELLNQYDFVQLMGVTPGAQGQEFHPAITAKIILLKNRGIAKPIWIDGGINPQSVKYLRNLDIDTLVVGSYLLESSNILGKKEEIEKSFYQV
ncbi:hypothetical protein HY345_03465 [Candidatus Microgenomates bacterium]|nr:hypothetical protein [Candidatus Microgenomates bacterium]